MRGHLFDNVVGFGRLLRAAGLAIGPEQLERSVRAIELAGVRNRTDFYWALAGALVTRPEHKAVFDQAFELFWRAQLRTRPVAEMSLWRREDTPADDDNAEAIATDILLQAPPPDSNSDENDGVDDQRNSAADRERFADKHFDAMSEDELAAAKRAIAQFPFDPPRYLARRLRRDVNGAVVDWRRSFRSIVRNNGALMQFAHCRRSEQMPRLVLLCDISGSMQVYSRVMLHFICALAQRRKQVHAFLFGTRLTNISRLLGAADIGRSVERVAAAARDFDGGTRIASALAEFNQAWSRRLLSRHSIVVLVSDGLDGEDAGALEPEIERLHRSCRHLMWLNPLLRFDGFEPIASGVKTILRHVDSVHAVHSLRRVSDVAQALSSLSSLRRGAARAPRPGLAAV